MSAFGERLAAALARREAEGLRRRLDTRGNAAFPHYEVEGRRLVNFAANDYLGLAADPAVVNAWIGGAKRWGVGAGAAHLLSGHTRAHARFEEALADFLGREAALVFSTGYMANLGAIGALVGRGDAVVEDKLNHASLLDGAQLSRARLLRYAHADAVAAETRLAAAGPGALLATDGVFSMDGDVAPLGDLRAAADRHAAIFMVDDAHGFGVLGARGRGSLEHLGLAPETADVHVVTFGKALGVFGAAVAGERALINTLMQQARSWIYTTALPPALAEALSAGLVRLRDDDWRRARVRDHVARFRAGCERAGIVLRTSPTPIQPLVIGSAAHALAVSAGLRERGFYVPAVRPPTVPEGQARLRIALSAAHEKAQVDGLVAALAEVVANTGACRS